MTEVAGRRRVALVLGGTNAHIALLENLAARGYRTVLVDYLTNPPARLFANEHVQISTLDNAAVLDAAVRFEAALVIATCVDQANVTACYVAEQLGLPAPYSHAVASAIADKMRMKQTLAAAGVPIAPHEVVEHQGDIDRITLPFPVVVKPADGTGGSKGVRTARNWTELRDHVHDAMALSRSGRALVEQYVRGHDLSVDCFVSAGSPHVIMLRSKFNVPEASGSVMNCYASLSPANVTPHVRQIIDNTVTDITAAFGFENTALLVQFRLTNDAATVIEFAPRIGGGLSHRTVKLNTGFDILDAFVDAYHGVRTAVAFAPPIQNYLTNNLYATPGVFHAIAGADDLLARGVIDEFYLHKTPGMKIGSSLASSDRVASFIIKAHDANEAGRRCREAMRTISVRDADGADILRRDIFFSGRELEEVDEW
jgi:biotin carboxylase